MGHGSASLSCDFMQLVSENSNNSNSNNNSNNMGGFVQQIQYKSAFADAICCGALDSFVNAQCRPELLLQHRCNEQCSLSE